MKTVHFTHILLAVALAICVSAASVFSQTEEATTNNSLRDGAWALQFQVGNNFTLSSFQGTVISVKRNCSPSHAIRVGVSLSSEFSDEDRGSKSFAPDTIRESNTTTSSSNSQNISLTGQYLFYTDPEAEVNFFFGGGPAIGFSRSNGKSETVPLVIGLNLGKTSREASSTLWSLGISGAAGIEWFFAAKFSLHAEYDASLSYVWQKDESTQLAYSASGALQTRATEENHRKRLLFSGDRVRFGLSVYL
jgi:hypothetical protein